MMGFQLNANNTLNEQQYLESPMISIRYVQMENVTDHGTFFLICFPQ